VLLPIWVDSSLSSLKKFAKSSNGSSLSRLNKILSATVPENLCWSARDNPLWMRCGPWSFAPIIRKWSLKRIVSLRNALQHIRFHYWTSFHLERVGCTSSTIHQKWWIWFFECHLLILEGEGPLLELDYNNRLDATISMDERNHHLLGFERASR